MKYYICVGDALAEVGLSKSVAHGSINGLSAAYLEGVDTKIDESIQLVRVPLSGCRVCDIDDSKPGLPKVPSIQGFNTATVLKRKGAHCQGVPFVLLIKYPPFTASSKMGDNCEI